MTKKPNWRLRVALFPLLAALFALICVYLSLSAFGYVFKYKDGKIVTEQSGAILLATRPGDAKIYLDGEPYRANSPIISLLPLNMNGLSLGEHTIRVEKNGFKTWEGIFNVEPGIVTWANYILLVSSDLKSTGMDFEGTVLGTYESVDKSKVLVSVSDAKAKTFSIWEMNLGSKRKRQVFETKDTASKYEIMAYSSQGNRALLVKTLNGKKERIVIAVSSPSQSWSLESTVSKTYTKYAFNPRRENEVFALSGGQITAIDYVARKTADIGAKNIADMYIDNELHLIKKESAGYSLSRLENNLSRTTIISKLPDSPGYTVKYLPRPDLFTVLSTKTGNLYLYSPKGEHEMEKIAGDIKWFNVSPDAKHIAYYNGKDLLTYNPAAEHEYTALKGVDVDSIAWLSDNANIIYGTNAKVGLVTFNGFYNQKLAKKEGRTAVYAAHNDNTFYYTLKDKSGLLDIFRISL